MEEISVAPVFVLLAFSAAPNVLVLFRFVDQATWRSSVCHGQHWMDGIKMRPNEHVTRGLHEPRGRSLGWLDIPIGMVQEAQSV
jgi:hypothetical protein